MRKPTYSIAAAAIAILALGARAQTASGQKSPSAARSENPPRAALLQSGRQLQQNIRQATLLVISLDQQARSAANAIPSAAALLGQIHSQLSGSGNSSILAQLRAAQTSALRGVSDIQSLPNGCGAKLDQIQAALVILDRSVNELSDAAAKAQSVEQSISRDERLWDSQIDGITNPRGGRPQAGASVLAQLRKQNDLNLYQAAQLLYQSLWPGGQLPFRTVLNRFAAAPLGSCRSQQTSTDIASAGTKPSAAPSAVLPGNAAPTLATPASKDRAAVVPSPDLIGVKPEPTSAHPDGHSEGNQTASQVSSAKAPDINAGLQSVAGILSSCGQGFGNTLKTRGVQMAGMIASAPFQLTNTITDLIKGDFSWDKDSAAPAWAQSWLSQNSDPTLLDSVLSGKPLNQPLPYEVCSGIADVAMSLPPGAVLSRIPIVTSLITKAVVYAPKIAPLISAGEKLGLLPKVLPKADKMAATTMPVDYKNQFFQRVNETIKNAHLQAKSSNNPIGVPLSDAIGVSEERIKAVAKIGAQDGNNCGVYAMAGCLTAAGKDIPLEDMKAAVQLAKLSRGTIKIDDDRVFDIAQMPKDQARIANKELQDQVRDQSMENGMSPNDGLIARTAGYHARNLERSLRTMRSFESFMKSNTSESTQQFYRDSAGLKNLIEKEVAQGNPVVTSISVGRAGVKDGGRHGVTILQIGRNSAGVKMVKYYNPWGTIDTVPWDDFFPFRAVSVK